MTEDEFFRVPRQRRFYPGPKSLRAQLTELGRWLALVPNRADRRNKRGRKVPRNIVREAGKRSA